MISINDTIPCEIEASEASPLLSGDEMRGLVEEVGRRIYHSIADLEISAWRTPEPLPFESRFSGEELHLRPGDRWGERLFDCAWFRFATQIPKGTEGELVARIDINGELFIADRDGNPVRGLTCKKSVFDQRLGTPSKTIFLVPESAIRNGYLELWADAAFNDLFGSLPDEGRIETAEICVCRNDIRSLYYDLEVLVDYALGLGAGDPERDRATMAVSKVAHLLCDYDAGSIAKARKCLQSLFRFPRVSDALNVSAVGHAHLDLAWLWPIRETIRKGARTFATALYNLERYPEYVFGASQPQLFAWMKEAYPVLYARIKKAVETGRIELQGTFWVEPDCNIPSGESFVRQVLHGSKFFRDEFGLVPRFCWQPDVFGYNGQLPQILKKSGHEYFMTQKLSWNVVNRFPYHSFVWKGIDGSAILTHMLAEETYNSPAAPHSLQKIAGEYAQRDVSRHALMVYGIGDGGGGPDAEHIERLRRAKRLSGLPLVESRSAAEFFRLWAADASNFPCWEGELYLERHQGTLTTQALTKRNNRLCELGLRELEWVGFLAEALAGITYPDAELDSLWKEVLLYQFHDILPGSSIKRVYDECNARQAIILKNIDSLTRDRYNALCGFVGSKESHVVFNSLPWARKEWLKVDNQWHTVTVPGMGYAPLDAGSGSRDVAVESDILENERLRVVFAEDGRLASIYDKLVQREVLAAGTPGNDLVIYEDVGDAWDFATDIENKDLRVYLRQNPDRPRLTSRSSFRDGPCGIVKQTFRYGSSTITQEIVLKLDEDTLEFRTRVEWNEPRKMLRVRFPVSVYSTHARFEIPFGSISRSTLDESLVEQAHIEVPAQQWVDLSDDNYGVSLFNDCKYGFRVKGNTLDMCLLRSVPHPGNALIGKDDESRIEASSEFTDLGQHRFCYAIKPHPGKLSEAEIVRCARGFNIPLMVMSRPKTATGSLPATASWIRLANPSVEIAAIKRAENGMGWIIRLINVMPTVQQTRLEFALPVSAIEETDLAEQPIGSHGSSQQALPALVSMAPFEIKTFRFALGD